MATSQQNQRDAITINYEGTSQFYTDTDKQTGEIQYNFGYGYNLNKNSDWASVLAAQGISSSTIAQMQAAMQSTVTDADARNKSSDMVAINASLGNLSSIATIKQNVLDDYFDNNVDPILQKLIGPYQISILPDGIRSSLEDMIYNSGTRFLGRTPSKSTLLADLRSSIGTGDYTKVAYELAYDTAPADFQTSGNLGYERRTTADALTALGFNVTLDGYHVVTSVSGNVEDTDVINFLRISRSADSRYLSLGAPADSAINAISQYTVNNGYYVSRPGDTLASIQTKFLLAQGQVPLLLDDYNANISDTTPLLPGTSVWVPVNVNHYTNGNLTDTYGYELGGSSRQLNNYSTGYSTLTLYEPTAYQTSFTAYFTGLNGTGAETKDITNLTSGLTYETDYAGTNGLGQVGSQYLLGANGSKTFAGYTFGASSGTASFSDSVGFANSLLGSENTAIAKDAATGPLSNSWLNNPTVWNLGGALSSGSSTSELPGVAPQGVVISYADAQVSMAYNQATGLDVANTIAANDNCNPSFQHAVKIYG